MPQRIFIYQANENVSTGTIQGAPGKAGPVWIRCA